MKTKAISTWIVALVSVLYAGCLHAQSTEFTYQGSLSDSDTPASGTYDMEFRLFDALIGGSQIVREFTANNVKVADGLFSVELDFGPVFSGADRYLAISVRDGSSTGNFTVLAPRQKLNPAPYAITAGNLSGNLPDTALSGTYAGAVNLSNAANQYSGNASALTQLNATQLKIGTVPDARLSANVAQLDQAQVFTADNVFTGDVGIGALPPTQRLDVNGQIRIRGGLPGAGKVLSSDEDGNAEWSPQKESALVVVVDASGGGDYMTIGAALAAISPTVSQPYVIDVRPGNYVERVVMKSHVHLRGSGMESTLVLFDPDGVSVDEDFAVVRLNQLENVEISHLTLAGRNFVNPGEDFDDAVGILDEGSSPVVRNVRVTGLFGYEFGLFGVDVFGIGSVDSEPIIEDCIFETLDASDGISLVDSNARITGNQFGTMWHAVLLTRSSALIANNRTSGANECVYVSDSQSSATIAHNEFHSTDNGGIAVSNYGEVRVVGNELVGDFEYGILNEGTAIVSANLFEITGLSALVDVNSIGSTYSANRFRNCGGAGEPAVTLIDSACVLVGNTFVGSPFGDIGVSGGAAIISNNLTTGAVNGSATVVSFDGTSIKAESNQLHIEATGGVGVGTTSPDAPITLGGTGTAVGGVTGFSEVMMRARRTGSSHSAISVDSEKGRDAIIYLAENGEARWGIRHDVSDGSELDVRYHKPGGGTVDALQVSPNGTLTTAGPVNPPSDRNMKQGFSPAHTLDVLDQVSQLPIQTWTYKQSPDVRHIGPMAQDFHAAFGLGADDKHIATVDADGVALAAIQGLNQKVDHMRAELSKRDEQISELKEQLIQLTELVDQINEHQSSANR